MLCYYFIVAYQNVAQFAQLMLLLRRFHLELIQLGEIIFDSVTELWEGMSQPRAQRLFTNGGVLGIAHDVRMEW